MRLTNYTRDRNVCPHLLILVHKWPQENSDRLKRCLTVLPEPNKGTNCKFIDNKLSNFDLMEAGLPQTIFGRQGLHSGGSSHQQHAAALSIYPGALAAVVALVDILYQSHQK